MPGESDNDAPGSTGSWATMYSLTRDEAAIKAGTKPVVPLVIRADAGDCLQVTLHNDLPTDNWTWTWGSGSTRAGFNIGNVLYNPQTSFGGAIGYDPDSTVAPGGTPDLRLLRGQGARHQPDPQHGQRVVLAGGRVRRPHRRARLGLRRTRSPASRGQSGIFADIPRARRDARSGST